MPCGYHRPARTCLCIEQPRRRMVGYVCQDPVGKPKIIPIAWDGHDATHPDERTTDNDGNAEFPNFRLPRVATAFTCRFKEERSEGYRC
jgi:hypothetical protein